MAGLLPSFPYPTIPQHGFWEPVTSTINWCEEDYYVSPYVAEFANTVTNLMFVFLAVKGLISCHRHGHDTVFSVAYAGYFAVGIGSLLFHASLKYPMQLVDELSMIYTTCLMAYASFSYSRTRTFRVFSAVSLVALALFITLYYHYLQDPAFHQTAYALLTAVVVFRTMFTMEYTLRPSLRQSEVDRELSKGSISKKSAVQQDQARKNARDTKILREMWILVTFGLAVFLGGFGIWTLDNAYCTKLRRWRHQVGMPWGFVLEGHAWWHLMTGWGAYCYIVWGIWLRHCLNQRQDEYKFVWKHLYRLPEVIRVDSMTGDRQSVQNGTLKKYR